MKIAVIAPNQIPARSANTIQVMKMAQAFAVLGHQIELIYPGRSTRASQGQPSWEVLAVHYGLQTRFPVKQLASVPGLRKYDFAWHSFRRAHVSGVDLVYTRLLQAAALASLMGLPTILELHELPGGKMGPALLKLFLAGRGRRRIAVISAALQYDLCRQSGLSPEGELLQVAPDGVDLLRYSGLPESKSARKQILPALKAGLEEQGVLFDVERFTAGYSGHLYSGRGVELIIELAVRLPGVNFLLMGGEPDQVIKYRQLVAGRGLQNLLLTGFIPNAKLPQYQAACDALLMPYQHQVAGSSGGDISRYLSPMKLFEYLACGRPILSSDLPVFREVLSPDLALLLPPDETERWVAALQLLQEDEEQREVLGERARQKAGEYSWEARAEKLLASLDDSLSCDRPGGVAAGK